MARTLRIEYSGATYHVMCRGNRGGTVFMNREDVALWLRTLSEACERSQLLVHAYCLMNTHYHLLLETPKGNLVEGMKWLQATFTQRYNAGRRQWGHLFQGRYKAKVVDRDPAYFRTAGLYVLLNPVDAGLIDLRTRALESYAWSAYRAYLTAPSKSPDWLHTQRLMSSLGIDADTTAGRRAFAACVKERGLSLQLKDPATEERRLWKRMERGWVHGGAEFREAMIARSKESGGAPGVPAGSQRGDIAAAAAAKALEAGLRLLKLRATDLAAMKKGGQRKLLLAGWLRRHFRVGAAWCAERLEMGQVSTITKACHFYENPPRPWKKQKDKLLEILTI